METCDMRLFSPRACKAMSRPRIAVTMGDPAGIGPEICLDLLTSEEISALCVPIVFGDRTVLEACAKATGKAPPAKYIGLEDLRNCESASVLDLQKISMDEFEPCKVSAEAGGAGYEYIMQSIRSVLAGDVDAVATAPIHKEALRMSGVEEPGHTEIFAKETGTERSCMMLTSDVLTCSFVTVHVGMCDVPDMINEERIRDVIDLTRKAMTRIRGKEPKLIVCGLNPHAGEGGLFGRMEEENYIIPAIEWAKAEGANIEGPLPPDTAFLDWRREETDAVICMYHDQGHIPLKALAFDKAINVTLGLPIVRTSVDHGTAMNIAWQGKANPSSLFEAVRLATKLCS